MWCELVMQSADGPALMAVSHVHLDYLRVQPMLEKLLPAPGSREMAALVFQLVEPKHPSSFQARFSKFHAYWTLDLWLTSRNGFLTHPRVRKPYPGCERRSFKSRLII